ncbi:MAG: type II secretion system F family protein [Candidatus Paceibacterota bacterium]
MKKVRKSKWNRRNIIFLLERLELYIGAGLTIDRALDLCKRGIPKKHISDLIQIKQEVESGIALWEGLSRFRGLNQTTSDIIKYGESSGQLVSALRNSRSLLEREDELWKRCLSAMTYPVIIGIFSVLMMIGLVRGVMPQIIPMLRSLNADLPLLTRIVMFFSEEIVSRGHFILIGITILFFITRYHYKRFIKIKNIFHHFLLGIPIIGSLIFNYALTVFLRSMGSLIETGSSVGQAYQDTSASISFIPIRTYFVPKSELLSQGIVLGDIIVGKKIPAYIGALLVAGEASGTLGFSIGRAASILDRDIENSLKRLTALIEPVMMAGMGIMVGAIALSIMMPIYDISKVLQR